MVSLVRVPTGQVDGVRQVILTTALELQFRLPLSLFTIHDYGNADTRHVQFKVHLHLP